MDTFETGRGAGRLRECTYPAIQAARRE
jgi:hypothetical protein